MIANEVTCYEDKGAYTSLGAPCSIWRSNMLLPCTVSPTLATRVGGVHEQRHLRRVPCFGVPQVLFALESNMDEAAESRA